MQEPAEDLEPVGRWQVFLFGREEELELLAGDEVLSRYGDVLERAKARRRRTGQPFLVNPDGRPDLRLNAWFASDELRALAPGTWQKYAYSLIPWLNYLWSRGCSWEDAAAWRDGDLDAQDAFKVWRTQDGANPRLVEEGTYGDNLIAIRLFYLWAHAEFGVANPIRVRRVPGRRRDGTPAERPVTAPKSRRDRDIKWFNPTGWERFVDVGFRGLDLEGEEDPSWRVRTSQRNASFADGLYGTGLRLGEWATVLLPELPADDMRGFHTCSLAQACAKGKRARKYWMPRRTLQATLSYVEGERATAVRNAQRTGRYENVVGARVLLKVLGDRTLRLRAPNGAVSDVPMSTIDIPSRRLLFKENASGLEPLSLWLNENGMPRDLHGWQHSFQNANARLASFGLVGFAGASHMCRHSFALRWYSVGRLMFERRVAHLTSAETEDFRELFGNPWDLVQLMLGHRDPRTTREIYGEPFMTLDVETLLMHAENSGLPDLMDAVFRSDPRVLSDPLAEDQ